MKKFILLSGTAASVMILPSMAWSQSALYSDAKGNSNASMQEDARTMQGEYAVRQPVASESRTRTERVYKANVDKRQNPYADFTGFYVGGDVGYEMGNAEINDPAGTDGDVGLDGFNGDIFVGYGFEHTFRWLGGYAGLEIAHQWSNSDGGIDGASYEKDGAWLVTFRPGLTMHQDTMGYGIIGYSRAEFDASNGADDNLDGFVVGAGAEFDTNTIFKTRLEYTYTTYESADLGGIDFDPHENNLKLGAVFRF